MLKLGRCSCVGVMGLNTQEKEKMGKEYHVDCAQGSTVIEKDDSLAMSCFLGKKKKEKHRGNASSLHAHPIARQYV